MLRLITPWITFVLISWPVIGHSRSLEGSYARYRILNVDEWTSPNILEMTIVVGPSVEMSPNQTAQWWSIRFTKPRSHFQIWCLGTHVPMSVPESEMGEWVIHRYILREASNTPIEYRDQRTGTARLPKYQWKENFLPHPTRVTGATEGWYTSGKCMGHIAGLLEVGTGAIWNLPAPESIYRMELDDDVLMGTGRDIRDINHGQKPDGDYTYRIWEREDVRELREAGYNLFPTQNPHISSWLEHEPVFSVQNPTPYPEIFFRANYYGAVFFIDEPAFRIGIESRVPEYNDIPYPEVMYNFLAYNTKMALKSRGGRISQANVNWGLLNIRQERFPAWETHTPAAFCEMEAGAEAVVLEGRFNLDRYNVEVEDLAGRSLEITAEEMIDSKIAFLRGAARAFEGDWGISVYGQADYEIAKMAVIRAYDAGAGHIWFWTSDFDHHLPWERQLELASMVTQRKNSLSQPRDKEALLKAARVAVVIPEGYIGTVSPSAFSLPWWKMYNNDTLQNDYLNRAGVPYRKVQAAIIQAGLDLLRSGTVFDYITEHPDMEKWGYEQLIHIRLDGTWE